MQKQLSELVTEGGQTYRAALNVIDVFEHGTRRDALICAQSAGFCADHFAGRAATLDTRVSYKLIRVGIKTAVLPYRHESRDSCLPPPPMRRGLCALRVGVAPNVPGYSALPF